MALIKFEPLKELENFHTSMQHFFEDFPVFGDYSKQNFSPRIDVSETENSILIEAEIPGVKKEDIKVSLQENMISIKGEKKSEQKDKSKNYYSCERSYGAFERTFALPENVDKNNIDAEFKEGVLKIRLNKTHPAEKEEKIIELK